MTQSYRDLLKGHTINTTTIGKAKLPPDVEAEVRKDQAIGDLMLSGEWIHFCATGIMTLPYEEAKNERL